MSLSSANGQLIAVSGSPSFMAYYVVVSYDQKIGNQTAFQSQTLICESNGEFRFFLPADALVDNVVLLEVHAPNGTLVHRNYHTKGSLNLSATPDTVADTTAPFTIEVDPLAVEEDGFLTQQNQVKGKLIDVLGKKIPANLQIVLWGSQDPAQTTFEPSAFQPILVDRTDHQGYFGGTLPDDTFESVWATVGSNVEQPIAITLESGEVPDYLILPLEYTGSGEGKEDCSCHDTTDRLPDALDLAAGQGVFSSDLGGSCNAEFKPNRTLEEFDYCTIVRTTEPQNKRHTSPCMI